MKNKGGRPRSREAQILGRPLTNTERSRKRRARLNEGRILDRKKPTLRKYHPDRAATAKERKERWKAKKKTLIVPQDN